MVFTFCCGLRAPFLWTWSAFHVDFRCLQGVDTSGIGWGWSFRSLENTSIGSSWTQPYRVYQFCSIFVEYANMDQLLNFSTKVISILSLDISLPWTSRSSQDNPIFPFYSISLPDSHHPGLSLAGLILFERQPCEVSAAAWLGVVRPEIQGSNLAESSRVFQIILIRIFNLRYLEVPSSSLRIFGLLRSTESTEYPRPCHLLRHPWSDRPTGITVSCCRNWICSSSRFTWSPDPLESPIFDGGVHMCNIQCVYTSSTAQGGGRSFKNRKPIGEIGCCESGMAERIHWWTERCLRSPLFLSLSLTIYLPTGLSSMYLSIYRSIYLSLSLFHLITYLPIYLSTYLPIYLSIYLSISLSLFHLSICLAVYLSICGAVSFSVM